MGTSQVLDDQYYAEELARGGPGPKVDNRQNAYDSQVLNLILYIRSRSGINYNETND